MRLAPPVFVVDLTHIAAMNGKHVKQNGRGLL
jgi:hypothetical protein